MVNGWFILIETNDDNNNRGLDVSRAYNPDAISPDQMMSGPNIPTQQGTIRMTSATPTMQQRIKALGVATPIALSSPVRRYVSASQTGLLFQRDSSINTRNDNNNKYKKKNKQTRISAMTI